MGKEQIINIYLHKHIYGKSPPTMKDMGRCIFFGFLITAIMTFSSGTVKNTHVTLASWNMRCIFDCAKPYLRQLANEATILTVSEHGLFPCELYKFGTEYTDYENIAKSSSHLSDTDFGTKQGIGGCAILWSKDISNIVKPLNDVGTDRICAIQVQPRDDLNLYVVAVYMPHQGCQIASFADELSALESIINELSAMGEVLVIGDINVHLGPEHGKRGWGKSSKNGGRFMGAMTRCQMYVYDINEGIGPRYTYMSGSAKTYLDHCMVSEGIRPLISRCEVLQDDVENVSDHLPLIVEINVPPTCQDKIEREQVAWHKASPEDIQYLYTQPLEAALSPIFWSHGINPRHVLQDPSCTADSLQVNLDEFVVKVTDAIHKAGKNLPQIKYNKFLKPYWDRELTQLSKESKAARWAWKNAGRPTDIDNPILIAYKSAKREFRRNQRMKTYIYELESMKKLGECQELDQKYFWYAVNKHRKKCNGLNPIQNDAGQLLTDTHNIRSEWSKYFQKLYKIPQDQHDDGEFDRYVEGKIAEWDRSELSAGEFMEGGPVTVEEVSAELRHMKNKKAPGHDNITAEHLKHGGEVAVATMTWIINVIVATETVPTCYKKGLMVPIPKAGKDKTIKDNNRGITLVPILNKLLERVILKRESVWLIDKGVIDEMQGAGHDHCSCLHTSMLVQETIAYHVNRGSTVYVAFLDIRKAFDTVWVEGLLYKLYIEGMNRKVWRLVKHGYENFQCAVLIGGKTGDWFMTERGVHQGAPLSMKLYQVFLNDLLVKMRESGNGTMVGNINVTSPSFADDTTAIALYKRNLNLLLDCAYAHSKKWKYEFNTDKSEAMIWGEDHDPHTKIKLGNNQVNVVSSSKHLGISLASNKKMTHEIYDARIGTARSLLYCARGIGSKNVPVAPAILSKVYWNVIIPKLTYGFEVYPVDETGIKNLEFAHRQNCKLIQGLPVNTPTPATYATLGWLSIQTYIDMKKIIFLWQVLCLENTNIYKRVVLYMWQCIKDGVTHAKTSSPVFDMYKAVSKNGMKDIIDSSIVRNSFGNIDDRKAMVKRLIWEHEKHRWRASCLLYHELAIYTGNVDYSMNVWWLFCKSHPHLTHKASALIAVLMGVQPRTMQRNLDGKSRGCGLCMRRIEETCVHVLFECEALNRVRNDSWGKLLGVMPPAMAADIEHKSKSTAAGILLSGLGGKYLKEWDGIYKGILELVWKIYLERCRQYDLQTVTGPH